MKFVRFALAAVIFSAAVSTAAQAQSWQRAGGNESTFSYVDVASRAVIRNRVTVLTQSVYAEPLDGGIYAVVIKSEFDCSANDFRTLEYSYYDINNNYMSTEVSETINEHKIPSPGSINEALLSIACTGSGGIAVSDPFTDAKSQFPQYR